MNKDVKYRVTKKTRAAQSWGCKVEELTELRTLIPIKYKDKILNYINKIRRG